MRWKAKKILEPKKGYKKIEKIFCFSPFKCDDGYTVWLGFRNEIYEYQEFETISQNTGSWWTKLETLSFVQFSLISEIATQDIEIPE